MAALFPISVVFFQFEGALPLFMVRELKFAEWAYGSLLLVNTSLIILLEIPLNLATSRWTHRRTLAVGAMLTALGFGALTLVSNGAGIVLTIVVWTFGEMILMPGSSAYVADLAPPERRGSYMGAFHATFSVAFAVGPWLGVALFDSFGGAAVWLACLIAGGLSAAMLSRVAKAEAA